MSYEIMREIAEEEYSRTEADAALSEEADRVTALHTLGESDVVFLKPLNILRSGFIGRATVRD